MKTCIKIIGICIIFLGCLNANAQLRIDEFGRIGMGTNFPNPEYKCHIKGNLLLTNFPDLPFYELRMKVGNGWPGVEIGSSAGKVGIWTSSYGWNTVYAGQYLTTSDIKLKSNIEPISGGLDKIMELNAYSYDIVHPKLDAENKVVGETFEKNYGFISQEVEKLFPEVAITADVKDTKLMDYTQIIPLLVSAVKEQQAQIETLNKEIETLSNINNSIDGNSNVVKETSLYQNKPNPFNEKTSIRYNIFEKDLRSASIMVFDMNGTLLKTYPAEFGENELTINGKELKAGMYIYSLIVNDVEVDTKRMILVK